MVVHRVAVLVLPAARPLDVGIPAQVFSAQPGMPYSLTMCGAEPGRVATTAGFDVLVPGGLDEVLAADTVIVPGYAPATDPPAPAVLAALRSVHDGGARVVSICTGAFALAAAGLLDGRRATTHWRRAETLARLYPDIQVDPDALYVDEGQILTSAGVSAGIDLCLHIVRRDLGAAAANSLARELVAAPHRDGGQRQYIERPIGTLPGTSLAGTRQWAVDHLGRTVTVTDLAEHACVSARTFARRFVAETGMTPRQWLLAARVERARELLETSDLSIDRVAETSGLGTPANFRTHFQRVTGTTPASYRRTFATRLLDTESSRSMRS